MDRIKYYGACFVICLMLFAVFNFTAFIDSLILIVFILSSITLVFSRDKLPRTKKSLEVPEIHYYYKARNNTYGYSLAMFYVGISILYSYLTMFLYIRQGPAILSLWAIALVGSFIITIKLSIKVIDDSIYDYVLNNSRFADQFKAIELIKLLIKENVKQKDLINNKELYKKMNKINLDDLSKTSILHSYLTYTESLEYRLTSDEINEYNRKQQ